MKQLACRLLASLVALLLSFNALAAMPISHNKPTATMAPMLAKVTPAIVNIAVEKKMPKIDEPITSLQQLQKLKQSIIGVGSGVIINAKKGYIVTNAHVVKDERVMLVTLKDGRRFRGKLIGKAPQFDIAVIQIPAIKLKSIPLGNSNKLQVGDFVAAIGSPFNLSQTVTSGMISALNRNEPKIEGFQSFIQTDAPINPGNSGGALVNLKGQLVGINTAIITTSYASAGIGFAIPSNMMKSLTDQLIKYGKISRGILGVIAENITAELATAMDLTRGKGVIVTQVVPSSPAAIAGVENKDVIMKVNDQVMHSAPQLRNTLALLRPGSAVTLSIMRNHKPVTLIAKSGDPKKIMQQQVIPFLAGMRLRKFSELEPDGKYVKGVIVADVSDTSAAMLAGVIIGDVITEANSQKITNLNALKKVAMSNPKQLLLKVNRANMSLYLVIEKNG